MAANIDVGVTLVADTPKTAHQADSLGGLFHVTFNNVTANDCTIKMGTSATTNAFSDAARVKFQDVFLPAGKQKIYKSLVVGVSAYIVAEASEAIKVSVNGQDD